MPVKTETLFASGARIVVRDTEWLVRRVDRTSTGGHALAVIGISELVRDKESVFLTEIDKTIEILDPADTKLVADGSSSHMASMLYLESMLRRTPPTDAHLYIGHRAAMDAVPYQLDPAIQALRQPRQRILIADAVGLGKTLEAGVLLSELIRRGKGKRILVLAVKSMLTQFQKELWGRFAIGLTRLDSVGIQRIRSRIPTSHNPFHYYDKAIISIDTLKQDAEYRTYLENAWWDVIVIDEAHNVAQRGHGSSLRARLAKLLSARSDTLIMLSATPHDGKARSFASIMNMLNPTAIADPDNYGPEDIKGLYIRRFKKDIRHQVETAFKERRVFVAHCDASPAEELAFDAFSGLSFTQIDQHKGAGSLFKTVLEKSLFSSPAACLSTIENRMSRLAKTGDSRFQKDIASLETLAGRVRQIGPEQFAKYQKLLDVVRKDFSWSGKDLADRLVIFTERIETLNFLRENLPKDLKIKESQAEILHGGMSDKEQQRIVEEFGKDASDVRLLIASDVASEGINLHYLCHRMIHFDIPWSLMVFQQRNGRIDRYGQAQTPRIVYLVTKSNVPKIRGDMRILELLIQKDEETVKNIGDPAEFMGVYDIDEEEDLTARAIESGQSAEEFAASFQGVSDPLSILFGDADPPAGEKTEAAKLSMPSLFTDDYAYMESAIRYLGNIHADFYPDENRIDLTPTDELLQRFKFLPHEIQPDTGILSLSSDIATIQQEISRSRKDEKAWPKIHYLWELNPVVDWINDKVLAAFGRHEAPVLELSGAMPPGETVFVMSCLIPNRKGHTLMQRWFGVCFKNGKPAGIESFESILERTGLNKTRFPNPEKPVPEARLKKLLPTALAAAREHMTLERKRFEDDINEKLNDHLRALETMRDRKYQHLDTQFDETRQPGAVAKARKEKARRETDAIFDEYMEWIEDTMTTEDNPHIRLAVVLKGEG